MGKFIQAIMVAILVLGSGHAVAGDPTLADIRVQQQELREKLERGDPSLEALSAAERAQLKATQRRVFAILDRYGDGDRIHPAERTELTNELERISAVVEGDDRNRLVCTREKRTGSQRHVRVCKTVAERERELENSQRMWDRANVCDKGLACSN